MFADREMMFRILLNLAHNAGTAGAKSIFFEVWQVGHLAIIDIGDDGSGIPRSAWPDLFLPFKSRQSSGGELGLAIARDLTIVQGGLLRLSRSSSEGYEFRLQFTMRTFSTLITKPVMSWHKIEPA